MGRMNLQILPLAEFGWAIPVWGALGLILAAIIAWILPKVFGE